ncbi:DUF1462 family protein [Bacillus sp. FJAT-44742]|uniref:DUF1462 family protein n=1 Tax=Bacillus sp. FJAT-44742 TaxID=2014005 RepID=UPI000C23E865|nr:DUF1462 family protein [Bacillus sp. FJAT-44742]
MSKVLTIKVYGAEKKCPSCINMPSAFETKEWLEAALTRKYPERDFEFFYVDIENPGEGKDKEVAKQIFENDLLYPLVTIENEIVAEGDPRLNRISKKIEELYQS